MVKCEGESKENFEREERRKGEKREKEMVR